MKIRTYFQTFVKTITSPIYYVDVLNAPFKFSLKFFLVSYLLLSLLATFFFVRFDLPKYKSAFDQTATEITQHYPADLQLNWSGKELTSTQKEPLLVPYPESVPHDNLPNTFVVISPSLTNAEAVGKLNPDSLLVIGKDSAFVSNSNGGWSTLLLKETPGFDEPFTISRVSLPGYISLWKNEFSNLLRTISIIFPIAYFFGMSLVRFFGILVNGLFVFFLLRLVGKSLPYKKILQVCMHITIVAELVSILTSHLVNPEQMDMFSLTYWLYLIVVLVCLWNVKSVILMKTSEKK